MDTESATRFKKHMDEVVKELSSALIVAQGSCTTKEFLNVRKLVGDIIARVDGLLHEAVYADHPDMNDLGRQK
jgi:hypothetical protein